MTFEEYKDYLITEIGCVAIWRDQKATEFPDDQRNADSAQSLNKIVDELRNTPAEFEGFRKLWKVEFGLQKSDEDRSFELVEGLSEALQTYGFQWTATTAPEFLDGLYDNLT